MASRSHAKILANEVKSCENEIKVLKEKIEALNKEKTSLEEEKDLLSSKITKCNTLLSIIYDTEPKCLKNNSDSDNNIYSVKTEYYYAYVLEPLTKSRRKWSNKTFYIEFYDLEKNDTPIVGSLRIPEGFGSKNMNIRFDNCLSDREVPIKIPEQAMVAKKFVVDAQFSTDQQRPFYTFGKYFAYITIEKNKYDDGYSRWCDDPEDPENVDHSTELMHIQDRHFEDWSDYDNVIQKINIIHFDNKKLRKSQARLEVNRYVDFIEVVWINHDTLIVKYSFYNERRDVTEHYIKTAKKHNKTWIWNKENYRFGAYGQLLDIFYDIEDPRTGRDPIDITDDYQFFPSNDFSYFAVRKNRSLWRKHGSIVIYNFINYDLVQFAKKHNLCFDIILSINKYLIPKGDDPLRILKEINMEYLDKDDIVAINWNNNNELIVTNFSDYKNKTKIYNVNNIAALLAIRE
jgi:hypothetical protein